MIIFGLERELIKRFACPECGSQLHHQLNEGPLWCPSCGNTYLYEESIWRLLTPDQKARYVPFSARYHLLRAGDGWERAETDYYLGLPYVKPDDPQAKIWRIRRRSLKRLKSLVGPGEGRWALELGAGNGWLSRQLTKSGFHTVALDLNAAGPDSLEGAALYLQHEKLWFGRVQASMEDLPFGEASFDLCVVSGALHYTNLEKTLPAVWKILEPQGQFIITDSPVYTQITAGKAMVEEERARLKTAYGQEPYWPGGAGFLVEANLVATLRKLGFEVETFSTERYIGRIKRWLTRPLKSRDREKARFPLIRACKPAQRNREENRRSKA